MTPILHPVRCPHCLAVFNFDDGHSCPGMIEESAKITAYLEEQKRADPGISCGTHEDGCYVERDWVTGEELWRVPLVPRIRKG